MTKLDLPNYKDQSHEVKARFDDLKQRDVILDVKHLGKIFDSAKGPVTALEDINLQVHRREFVTVIGPSGCGKSTLIRTLAGLESATSGEVLLEGASVNGPGPDRGMCFRAIPCFPG